MKRCTCLFTNTLKMITRAGLEIRILEPGAISLKIARKLLLVHIFVHKFIWEPGAFHQLAGANLLFCSCYFKPFTRRITSLILFRRRNYLQFFTFWIFFNPTNYANLYLTIYSFILECLQYQTYGLRWNKRDLFTIRFCWLFYCLTG